MAIHTRLFEDRSAKGRVIHVLDGMENEGTRVDGSPVRLGFQVEEAKKILEAKGKLPMGEYLRCRVRHFGDGLALGTRAFVEEIYQENRKRFGKNRQTGARRMRGVEMEPGLPELRVGVFG